MGIVTFSDALKRWEKSTTNNKKCDFFWPFKLLEKSDQTLGNMTSPNALNAEKIVFGHRF